jgi:hypothetical protein
LFAYDMGVNLGVTVAALDVDWPGRFDILMGPTSGTPTYRVFRGSARGVLPPTVSEETPVDLPAGFAVVGRGE